MEKRSVETGETGKGAEGFEPEPRVRRFKSSRIPKDFFDAAKAAVRDELRAIGVRFSHRVRPVNWRLVRDGFSRPSSVSGAYHPGRHLASVKQMGRPGRGFILFVMAHEKAHAEQDAQGLFPTYFQMTKGEGDEKAAYRWISQAERNCDIEKNLSRDWYVIREVVLDSILAELDADARAEAFMDGLGLAYRSKHREAYDITNIFLYTMAREAAFPAPVTGCDPFSEVTRQQAKLVVAVFNDVILDLRRLTRELRSKAGERADSVYAGPTDGIRSGCCNTHFYRIISSMARPMVEKALNQRAV